MGARCRGTDNYLKSLMFGVASAGRGVGPGELKSRAALCLGSQGAVWDQLCPGWDPLPAARKGIFCLWE